MTKRALSLAAVAIVLLSIVIQSSAATAAGQRAATVQTAAPIHRGYRPLHPAELRVAKRYAAEQEPASSAPAAPAPLTPTSGPSWEGLFDTRFTPPDTTGAVGPSSYIEMVNSKIGIYDRTGALLTVADLTDLAGTTHQLSDPRILWDTSQDRFYYSVLDVATNTIRWGYSKTASPLAVPDDFCNYNADFGYGTQLPDFPMLGDTHDFLLIGTNVFSGSTYVGSDIDWINKSVATETCPAQSSFLTGRFTKVKNQNGSLAATPVPVIQTDVSPTGYVLATKDVSKAGTTGTFLTVFRVKPSGTNPDVPSLGAGHAVTVASYAIPPAAKQCNTTIRLDTSDARLFAAISGVDPVHTGKLAIWTAQTVAGGAGSEARWYEINPAPTRTPTIIQQGTATSSSLYVFNATISPDRAVTQAGSAFGGNMVLNFNTSSATSCPAIRMLSKIGDNAQSGFVLVKQSPGYDYDGGCPCRWGDYSGTTPDPAADLTGTEGRVWATNEWNVASTNTAVDWRSWNWEAAP